MKLLSMLLLWPLIVAPLRPRCQVMPLRHPEYVLERGVVLDIRHRCTPEFDQVVTSCPDERATFLNRGCPTAHNFGVNIIPIMEIFPL
jgi:hypothetical protein